MRVISGQRRGLRLFSPIGESVRPTLDYVKEAAFNIMQFDLPGCVFLDMFSGSGQMGIEALSRGAECAYMFEPDRAAFATVRKNLELAKLDGAQAFNSPYSRLSTLYPPARIDAAYLDPPFGADMYGAALDFLIGGGYCGEGATIICEAAKNIALPERVGEFSDEIRRYGQVCLHIYRVRREEKK